MAGACRPAALEMARKQHGVCVVIPIVYGADFVQEASQVDGSAGDVQLRHKDQRTDP